MLRINLPEIVVEESIEDIISSSLVVYGERYQKPEPMVNVLDGINELNYLNYGGMSAVFGKQKSRKTFYLSLVMAAAVGNTVIDEKFRGYTDGKINLWFDTEQSKYYTARIPYRIVRKLGLKAHPENLKVLSIKKYTTEDRIRIIQYFIDTHKSNLGLIIIDGIRDLVSDFNNLTECTELMNRMMNWVDTTNCHVCSVLHINPKQKGEDEKPRGHLGSELQNKVESSILIDKMKEDKNVSVITPRDFRDKDIEPFGIRIDDKGVPYLITMESINMEASF